MFLKQTPSLLAFFDHLLGSFFRFEDLVGHEAIERRAFSISIANPAGMTNNLGLVVSRDESALAQMSLHRTREQAGFNAREIHFLEEAAPHLRRSVRTYVQQISIRAKQEAYEAALEAFDSGVMLLHGDRRIAFANRTANKILDKRDGLRCHRRRLEADSPLACVACPIGERGATEFQGCPSVMLLLQSPDNPAGGRVVLLARHYGLSPRQAQMAELLAGGTNLKQISEQMDVGYDTAKTHLRRILDRTHTVTQSELIRLITSGPVGVSSSRH